MRDGEGTAEGGESGGGGCESGEGHFEWYEVADCGMMERMRCRQEECFDEE